MCYKFGSMTNYPHLPKAPITEALIDIRVELPQEVTFDTLKGLYENIKEEFPGIKTRFKIESEIRFGDETAPIKTGPRQPDGLLFTSGDQTEIMQARLDGFTFSKLKPYQTWEELYEKAFTCWELYRQVATPTLISRVATRYINRLELPFPIVDFGEFLKGPPTLSENLPQVDGFFTRVVVREPALGCIAIITQSFDSIPSGKSVPMILDIDVYKDVKLDPDENSAWDFLRKLRGFKNRIFFESITEKLLEFYK